MYGICRQDYYNTLKINKFKNKFTCLSIKLFYIKSFSSKFCILYQNITIYILENNEKREILLSFVVIYTSERKSYPSTALIFL